MKRHPDRQVGQVSDLPITRDAIGKTYGENLPRRALSGQVKDLPYWESTISFCP